MHNVVDLTGGTTDNLAVGTTLAPYAGGIDAGNNI